MSQLLFRYRRHIEMSLFTIALIVNIATAYGPRHDNLFDGVDIIICVNLDLSIAGDRTCKKIGHNRTLLRNHFIIHILAGFEDTVMQTPADENID